ncbi:DUF3604 domain-containing protein [Bacilliculturomica massiliensis]|uniref:DUF3604 domain-containing protein n=1 Tax=Bacilliculturomica massiliensis TaxID=1917867 RepID=UPI0013EF4EF7|nr:DUF3604 domain-containing protein [Bacilliculturomica massiliensis]
MASENLGKLQCHTEGERLTVGLPGTVHMIFTVGRCGIDDGGSVWFIRHGVTDWQAINTVDETAMGYSTVWTTGDARVILRQREGIRPYETAVAVTVQDGCLREGDRVEVILGDRSKGSPGILTQTVAEENHTIFAAVDSVGSGRFEEVHPPCRLSVGNGVCADFHVILPSTVYEKEEFDIKLRVLDSYGNRCADFVGEVLLLPESDSPIETEEIRIAFRASDRGVRRVRGKMTGSGVCRLRAELPYYGLKTISNPCRTISRGEKKLFWGDMHAQNLMGSGIGSMDDSLTFAKEVGALDFTGWQGNDFEVSEENWKEVSAAVKDYHEDGSFVVFLGYEWSGITANGGDHNIYFRNDGEQIFRSSGWLCREPGRFLSDSRFKSDTDRNPVSELWREFAGRDDVMAIPHVGGRFANFDFFNEELTSLIEIHSHHGVFEWFLEEAVRRNMKVGFIAASDDHTSRVGLSYPMGVNESGIGATFDVRSGLTAVCAEELTREGLWKAFRTRSCYAATAARILLDFSVGGYSMGSEGQLTAPPEIRVCVNGTAPIDRIEIYRGLELICSRKRDPFLRETEGRRRIKIVWSGVRTKFRNKSVVWTGTVYVRGGLVAAAEDYSIDNPFEGIQSRSAQIVNFRSKTSGDEDGMILDIIPAAGMEEDCEIIFSSAQRTAVVRLGDLAGEGVTIEVGDVNRRIRFTEEEPAVDWEDTSLYDMDVKFVDQEKKEGLNIYYAKVFQKDGNRAWSSPVFIHCHA